MARNLGWAARALEQIWLRPKVESALQSIEAAEEVIRKERLSIDSGSAFCLAGLSPYVDFHAVWGDLSQEDSLSYFELRCPQCILPKASRLPSQSFPAFPNSELVPLVGDLSVRLGLPANQEWVHRKGECAVYFEDVVNHLGQTLRLNLRFRLLGKPTVSGQVSAFEDGVIVFRLPAERALMRIRWQIVGEGQIALREDVERALTEPLTVFSIFMEQYLQEPTA